MSGVLEYALRLQTGAFTGPIGVATSAFRGLGNTASATAGILTKVVAPLAALAGAGSAAALAFKSISSAADMEILRTAFVPLLGGVEEARKRMQELSEFAASTPFEMPEIAKASQVLQTLTRGALATGKGLTLVGDLASATNQPFSEIAVTVGRLYDGLQSGRPVGEAAARLQELGAISGDVRGRLESLQKEGAKGQEVWEIAAGALERFSGSMELQSQTWNGKISTFKDNIGLAMAAFGEPILDQIKPYLDSVISTTGALAQRAAEFGKQVGQTLAFMAEAWRGGELPGIIGGALKLAFMESTNTLYAAMRGTMNAAGQAIIEQFKNSILYFQILTTPDFWSGMGQAIVGVFLGAISFLQRGLAEALEIARPLAELFGKGDSITNAQGILKDSANILSEDAASRFAASADLFGPIAERVAGRMREAGENIARRYQEGFSDAGEVFDTTDTANRLAKSIDTVKSRVEEAAKKAADAVEKAAPAAATPKEEPEPPKKEPTPPAAPVFNGVDAAGLGGEAAGPQRRGGVLSLAESIQARLARRSRADIERDARLGRTEGGISQADRLGRIAEAKRLSPANAAAELGRASAGADPGKVRRDERAEAARKPAETMLQVVKAIDEKLNNLTSA